MWKDVFDKNQEKEGEEYDYGEYVGLVCQVVSDENKLFFVGKLDDYDSINKEMKIVLHKGEQTPQGLIYNTPVKISTRNNGDIIVLYGAVTGQTASYWRVEMKDMIKCPEQRDGFRQPLKCKATIVKYNEENDEATPIQCDLINISLTGMAFRSDVQFNIDEIIWVDEAVLNKKCPTKYSFKCIVKRTFKDEKDRVCYGCEFIRLPASVENSLCKDLFYLQAQSIKGN